MTPSPPLRIGCIIICVHTKPNSLYVGFAFLFSELESERSRVGSYVHLTPLVVRPGFRACMRSMVVVMVGGTGVEAPLVAGLELGRIPLTLSPCWSVAECAFDVPDGFVWDGESMVVRGVMMLLWAFDCGPIACRVDVLNTEELELA